VRFVDELVRGGDNNEAEDMSSSSSAVDVLSDVGKVKLALVSSSSSGVSSAVFSFLLFINDFFFFARALDARRAAAVDFLFVFFFVMLRELDREIFDLLARRGERLFFDMLLLLWM
jgi:hypothetical protein